MEKKVYEGYKRTATNKTAASKATAAKSVSATKKTATSPNKTTTKSTRPNAKPAGKTNLAKPRLAMFIDVDNAGISRENLLEVLFYANGKYQIESCKLYGFSEDTLPGIRDIANEYNVVTIGKMKFKQPGTNCVDSRLLVDAYECALNNKNKIDMIFVWCYPCDLENLFEKIVNLGVNTATIANSVFDCKNKFVSQTFKLYSSYDFSFEKSAYGKVRNEPAEIAPNNNIEDIPTTSENEQPTVVEPASATPTTEHTDASQNSKAQLSPFDEGYVPPVLPRRTIVERSNPNEPKLNANSETESVPESESETNNEESSADDKPTSLVEEIARKLNLQIDSNDELMDETDEQSATENAMFMDMLKQAGFGDQPEEKSLKYEDTIGDL